MKYRLIILVNVVLVTFSACNSSGDLDAETKIKLSGLIKSKIDQNVWYKGEGALLFSEKFTKKYYESVSYEPVWINDSSLNKQGEALLELIGDARQYGLLPEFYSYSEINTSLPDSLIHAELLLTNAFYLLSTHINSGFIDSNPDTAVFVWVKDSLNFDHMVVLESVKTGEPVKEKILELQPKFWEYKQLQKGLADYLLTYELHSKNYEIPSIKEDSAKCYDAAKEALLGHFFINKEEAESDSLFIEKLKAFQEKNGLKPDAVVGKWTSRVLAKSNEDRFYQAALSLEKWRWKAKDTIPSRRIWVNIPAYTLKIIEEDKVLRKHRVVVGAYTTQTPEFHASLKRMVTNPFWFVPYSIASTEILYGIKKDTNYLASKGYKIFRDGAEVDSKTVDWSEVGARNFRYHVRQNGGGGNSLGRIKFLFPNQHSVFIHDTPSKSLFWNDVRAYSHGCVRLHEPFELAKTILELDESLIVSDTLDSMIVRGTQRVIELKQPIEVYIEYFSAVGDSSGQIIFYPDVYGRDEKFIKLIKQNVK